MGSTIIKPGEETFLIVRSQMHPGMEGPHLFRIALLTNDRVEPVQTVDFRADFR